MTGQQKKIRNYLVCTSDEWHKFVTGINKRRDNEQSVNREALNTYCTMSVHGINCISNHIYIFGCLRGDILSTLFRNSKSNLWRTRSIPPVWATFLSHFELNQRFLNIPFIHTSNFERLLKAYDTTYTLECKVPIIITNRATGRFFGPCPVSSKESVNFSFVIWFSIHILDDTWNKTQKQYSTIRSPYEKHEFGQFTIFLVLLRTAKREKPHLKANLILGPTHIYCISSEIKNKSSTLQCPVSMRI